MVNPAPPGAVDLGKIYFSQVFKADPETLEAYGAFDISLLTDLPLRTGTGLQIHVVNLCTESDEARSGSLSNNPNLGQECAFPAQIGN